MTLYLSNNLIQNKTSFNYSKKILPSVPTIHTYIMQKWSYIANLHYIHLEASEQQCFGIVPILVTGSKINYRLSFLINL